MNMETLVPDDLWALIALLLPPRAPHRKGGRPWLSDRRALAGIIFILKTGCAWNTLPRVLGCGSGSTCYRRLAIRYERREELHQALLDLACALICLKALRRHAQRLCNE